jgi:AcrR family transcriptional regulator
VSGPAAYAHLLKRVPGQNRSVRRVDAILDAAADLLRDREPDEIAMRELADAAGVPTGTIYQFFADKQAVLQALALRFNAAMPEVLESGPARAGDWASVIDHVVDGYAAMFRRHPAIRALWLTGALDAATRRAEVATDATIAQRLGDLLTDRTPGATGSRPEWRTLVALIDGLLRHAFAEDPGGDETALREARRAARAYAGVVLGVVPESGGRA